MVVHLSQGLVVGFCLLSFLGDFGILFLFDTEEPFHFLILPFKAF